MSNLELIHAYRHLLRHGLRAVQFSLPARLVIQFQLRRSFRVIPGQPPKAFNPEAVRRTIWFLKAAAAERGLEHKILKNLVKVAWAREKADRATSWRATAVMWEDGGTQRGKNTAIKSTAYEHYEATIAMLNHSMGLCLPLR